MTSRPPFDPCQPLEPTPDRMERFHKRLRGYILGVRDSWIANGEDVDSEEGRGALALIAVSMGVDGTGEWMSPVEAYGTLVLAFPGCDRTRYALALRTRWALAAEEKCATISLMSGLEFQTTWDRFFADEVPTEPDGTALYRHYDRDGTLLYAGIARDPQMRAAQHAQQSPWYKLSHRMDVEWFTSRREARDAEREAIQNELPLFNVVNLPSHARRRALEYLLAKIP